jgi:hypothetical protein
MQLHTHSHIIIVTHHHEICFFANTLFHIYLSSQTLSALQWMSPSSLLSQSRLSLFTHHMFMMPTTFYADGLAWLFLSFACPDLVADQRPNSNTDKSHRYKSHRYTSRLNQHRHNVIANRILIHILLHYILNTNTIWQLKYTFILFPIFTLASWWGLLGPASFCQAQYCYIN